MTFKVDIQEYALNISPYPVAQLKSVHVLNGDTFIACESRLAELGFKKTGAFLSESLGRMVHTWTRARYGFVDFANTYPPVESPSGIITV